MSDITRLASKLHLDAKQIQALMLQMQGDTKFQVLFDYLFEYRENAIADLCNDAVVSDANKVFATIGEIRAYTAILSLAGPGSSRPDSEAAAD